MGKGGRQRIEDILGSGENDDVVMTGAFLASAIDERGSVVSVRRKYIHSCLVGGPRRQNYGQGQSQFVEWRC